MPRQWKLIALYMVIVYLTFMAIIYYDRNAIEKEATANASASPKDQTPMPFTSSAPR